MELKLDFLPLCCPLCETSFEGVFGASPRFLVPCSPAPSLLGHPDPVVQVIHWLGAFTKVRPRIQPIVSLLLERRQCGLYYIDLSIHPCSKRGGTIS